MSTGPASRRSAFTREGPTGFEPATSTLATSRSAELSYDPIPGTVITSTGAGRADDGNRTRDILLGKQALCRLSYIRMTRYAHLSMKRIGGPGEMRPHFQAAEPDRGFEPRTSSLPRTRSAELS